MQSQPKEVNIKAAYIYANAPLAAPFRPMQERSPPRA